jgi:hypothetical protein
MSTHCVVVAQILEHVYSYLLTPVSHRHRGTSSSLTWFACLLNLPYRSECYCCCKTRKREGIELHLCQHLAPLSKQTFCHSSSEVQSDMNNNLASGVGACQMSHLCLKRCCVIKGWLIKLAWAPLSHQSAPISVTHVLLLNLMAEPV